MAVPPRYDTVGDYLEDAVDFLNVYSWLYCSPNTHVLVDKVLEKFPDEWLLFLRGLTNEEVNNLSLSQLPEKAPESLKKFFSKIDDLKFFHKKENFEEIKFPNNSGLSKKKEHEIASLAPLVHEICQKSDCDFIIDVGTGLGYLPRLLYDRYKYRSLAIEGSSEKLRLAKLKQTKFVDSKDSIIYFEHFVTNASEKSIREALKEISMKNACMTGLHACADLSITVLELFTRMEFAKSLVIMPCCYHRLKQNDDGFEKFPVSEILGKVWRKFKGEEFLKVPFMRLACQRTVDSFSKMSREEHEEHANCCLFRAILEDVAVAENYQVKRLKRKSGRPKQENPHLEPFDSYLTNLKRTHTLIGGEISDHQFLEKMREKWTQHKGNAYLIEALAGFQAALQNICENVVLLDRVMFLKEKGIDCFVVKVTDEGISPRCHALVAVKP